MGLRSSVYESWPHARPPSRVKRRLGLRSRAHTAVVGAPMKKPLSSLREPPGSEPPDASSVARLPRARSSRWMSMPNPLRRRRPALRPRAAGPALRARGGDRLRAPGTRWRRGSLTAHGLAEPYLARIEALDRAAAPTLRSVIESNPDALAIADGARRGAQGGKGPRGPLHGIPVLIKDNIDTARPDDDHGGLAGARGIGRRRGTRSWSSGCARRARSSSARRTSASGRTSARRTRPAAGAGAAASAANPYALDRNPCGSSSGSGAAVAANLVRGGGRHRDRRLDRLPVVAQRRSSGSSRRSAWSAAPASSRSRTRQDTAGPMARTVADAAVLLGALAGVDPRDPATRGQRGRASRLHRRSLDADGLRGARIGVARKRCRLQHPASTADRRRRSPAMKRRGRRDRGSRRHPHARRSSTSREIEVLLYEFKADLNAYLAALGRRRAVAHARRT